MVFYTGGYSPAVHRDTQISCRSGGVVGTISACKLAIIDSWVPTREGPCINKACDFLPEGRSLSSGHFHFDR